MKTFGLVSRLRNAIATVADNTNQIFRQNQLGEILIKNIMQDQYGQEGTYFVTTTPTIGTPVALGVAANTAFSATAPAFLIRNSAAAGGVDILLKRLRMLCVGVGTSGTDLNCAIVVDSTNRYSSGGAQRTPVNAKADYSNATSSLVYDASTAIVATAAGAITQTKLVARFKFRTGITVTGDMYSISCGSEPTTETGLLSGTAAALYAIAVAPIVIPPGGTALVYIWSAAQTVAPTFEYTLETVER